MVRAGDLHPEGHECGGGTLWDERVRSEISLLTRKRPTWSWRRGASGRWMTNSIEHDHAEVRRRTRVVRIFPNEASLIRLTTALTIERNEQWLERACLTMPETETETLRQIA